MRRPTSVDLMLGATIVIWAFNITVTRYVLTHGFRPLAYGAIRYGAAALLAVAATFALERSLRVGGRRSLMLIAAASIFLLVNQFSFVYALKLGSATTVALILGMTPIFAAIMASVVGLERLGGRFWIATAIGCVGVALVALGSGGDLSSDLGGDLLAILLAMSWAAYSVTIAPLMRRYSPYRISAVVLLVMCVPFVAASSPQIASQNYASLGGLVWAGLAFAIVGPLFLTNLLWFTAIHRVGPSRATLFANIQPFVAAVFAFLILSESLHWLQIVGGVTILLGIVLERRWRRARVEPGAAGPSKIQAMAAADAMPLEGWDHVELWVGNARQAAYYFEHAFGFARHAYAGPETGVRDRASYVLRQGEISLVLTSALSDDHEIARFACKHGDGVRDIALRVPNAEEAYRVAVERGARGVREPEWREDEFGRVQIASIATYGAVVHSFVGRADYAGPHLPDYVTVDANDAAPAGLTLLDHCVGNVELGKMNEWVGFYERVLGFENIIHYDDEQIHTEYSALMSKVMADGEGKIKFPINEPAEGRRKSQISEYLEYNGGPGVQHVAIQTDDIVKTVETMQERGVLFLTTPETYYEDAFDRVGDIEESWADLRRLRILVDRDEDGYLLQIFTKPTQDRPTLFFEVIQRHGARTFGEGNFKALFEAIEREQALRGNL